MVAVECPVTSTGFRVLTAMFRHRDHGIEDLDRYALVDIDNGFATPTGMGGSRRWQGPVSSPALNFWWQKPVKKFGWKLRRRPCAVPGASTTSRRPTSSVCTAGWNRGVPRDARSRHTHPHATPHCPGGPVGRLRRCGGPGGANSPCTDRRPPERAGVARHGQRLLAAVGAARVQEYWITPPKCRQRLTSLRNARLGIRWTPFREREHALVSDDSGRGKHSGSK